MDYLIKWLQLILEFFKTLGEEQRAKNAVDTAVIEYKEKIGDKGKIVEILPMTKEIPAEQMPVNASEGVKALWGTTGIEATGKFTIRREKDVQ